MNRSAFLQPGSDRFVLLVGRAADDVHVAGSGPSMHKLERLAITGQMERSARPDGARPLAAASSSFSRSIGMRM